MFSVIIFPVISVPVLLIFNLYVFTVSPSSAVTFTGISISSFVIFLRSIICFVIWFSSWLSPIAIFAFSCSAFASISTSVACFGITIVYICPPIWSAFFSFPSIFTYSKFALFDSWIISKYLISSVPSFAVVFILIFSVPSPFSFLLILVV